MDMINDKGVKSMLVTSADGKLNGIITNRDLRFVSKSEYSQKVVRDFMTPKKDLRVAMVSNAEDLTPHQAKQLLQDYKVGL